MPTSTRLPLRNLASTARHGGYGRDWPIRGQRRRIRRASPFVCANWKLRDEFSRLTVKMPSEKGKPKPQEEKINVYFPPMAYCTDNGAMIAFAGAMRLAERQAVGAFNVTPRWPLSDFVKQG